MQQNCRFLSSDRLGVSRDDAADLVSEEELSDTYILPLAFDSRVGPAVASAVAEAARRSGVARA